jgi:hypothetical protein
MAELREPAGDPALAHAALELTERRKRPGDRGHAPCVGMER